MFKVNADERMLGKIVLYRTHNNDLMPALVMDYRNEDELDLMVFDAHDNGRMLYCPKVPRDEGDEDIPFDGHTWLPRYGED